MINNNLIAIYELEIWLLSAVAIIILLYYLWKIINKQIISYQRLSLLDKHLAEENKGIISQSDKTRPESEALEETDPIEEAKIFSSYGKFEQAITILQWQIRAFPNEIIPYSELFIIYIHLEDESAYIKLLKLLPFAKDSQEYQGAFANGLLSFPDNEVLLKCSKQNREQKEVKEEHISQQPAYKAEQPEIKNKNSKKPSELNNKAGRKLTTATTNNPSGKLLVVTNRKISLQKLSPLEQSIFLAFDNNAQVAMNLQKQKRVYKNNKYLSAKKIIKNKNLLIKVKNIQKHSNTSGDEIENKPEQSIINQFNEFVASQKYHQAAQLLESYLKHNPLLDMLYPMLLQTYIQFKMLEEYYSFRQIIFSHDIQPSIDIILLINDTENRIKAITLKPQQAA
ncbi:MAG: hypothetical protein QM479_07575 [Pseudomonadota bacterium]